MHALIPARNEGPRVGGVVRAALPHVESVVVVVNGSRDDTADRAREAGAQVIESEPGYTAALKAGFRHLRGGAIVQLDADGQHPPAAIPTLRAALADADVVIASRFLGEPGYRVGWRRRVAIQGLAWLTSALVGQRLHDVTSGFQALSPRAVEVFAEHYPDECADALVILLAHRMDLRVTELPVAMRDRQGGDSMHDTGAFRYFGRLTARTVQEGLRL